MDGFCCLRGVLGVDRDAGVAVGAEVSVQWNAFGQLVLLLAGGDMLLMVGADCTAVEALLMRRESGVALRRWG